MSEITTTSDRKKVCVSIDKNLDQQARQVASDRNQKFSAVVDDALSHYFEALGAQDPVVSDR